MPNIVSNVHQKFSHWYKKRFYETITNFVFILFIEFPAWSFSFLYDSHGHHKISVQWKYFTKYLYSHNHIDLFYIEHGVFLGIRYFVYYLGASSFSLKVYFVHELISIKLIISLIIHNHIMRSIFHRTIILSVFWK